MQAHTIRLSMINLDLICASVIKEFTIIPVTVQYIYLPVV